jgi:hypothetical protein
MHVHAYSQECKLVYAQPQHAAVIQLYHAHYSAKSTEFK